MSNESNALTDRELQSLRNMGCEFEKAANEVESLRAQLAARVPDGWKLVPVEPTDEMCETAMAIDPETQWVVTSTYPNGKVCSRQRDSDAAIYYRAMLSAAPSQQAPVAQVSKDSPSGEPVAWTNPGAKGKTFHEIMVQAHSFCPTELPHLQKMKWMADYYEVNRQQQASEPMTEHEILIGWSKSKVWALSLGIRHQAFCEGVRFAEQFHNIKGKQ